MPKLRQLVELGLVKALVRNMKEEPPWRGDLQSTGDKTKANAIVHEARPSLGRLGIARMSGAYASRLPGTNEMHHLLH